jgi:hypothetical protein
MGRDCGMPPHARRGETGARRAGSRFPASESPRESG